MVKSSAVDLPLLPSMLCGGIAGSIAEIMTLPMDTVKVRMMVQKLYNKPGEIPKYKGLADCAVKMAKDEGIAALWSGWNPGIQRQMVFASIRIGLYFPIRQMIAGEGVEPSLW